MTRADAPRPVLPERAAPLGSAQRRLWFLHEALPGSLAYNVPSAHRLVGSLDVDCLRRSLEVVVARHGALRTRFDAGADGEAVQIVPEPPSRVESQADPLPVTLVTGRDPAERLERAARIARERVREPFDLRRGPLFRAELLRLAPEDHVLLLAFHHVVADHWSLAVLLRDLETAYRLLLRGEPADLGPPPLQAADLAALEQRRLDAGELEPQLAYWRRHLDGLQPLELPVDRVPSAGDRHDGRQLRFHVPAATVDGLTRLARERRATLFMAVAAGFVALLARISGQEDVAVAAAVANRNRAELEEVVGFLVNMVVLRVDLSGDPPFGELLERVRDVALDAHDHQDAPFERVVEEVAPGPEGDGRRDPARTPLVNVVLSFLNPIGDALRLPGVDAAEIPVDPGVAKLDLDVAFAAAEGGLNVDVAYRTGLFEQATVERLFERLTRLLAAAVADPALRLSGLPLVTPEERAELLARGAGAAPVAPPEPLVRTFERCAAARPDAVALSCDTRAWTYRELVRRAGRLARRLRRLGVGPESLVGVCARRSPEAVAGMLAVLEAGGAYLPLDPEHPPERLAFILRDAGARVVLAPAELRHLVPDDRTAVALDDPGGDLGEDARDAPAPPTGPRHLAYVIYTSGSTGEPKGVLVEQEGVANLCAWIPRAFGLGPDDVFLWTGSPAFDVSVLELWPALLAGARVEVLEDALVDPERLRDHVVERGVTLAALVAGTTEGLLRRSWPRSCRFRLIISGGERLRRRPSPETPFELVNSYGPTELTVISTTGAVERHGAGLPHVGLPLPGHRAAVVDGRGELVPEDVVGELCVGGVGVARGYAGRPRHTAECFVPDPDGPPGSRRYRTGDLVRWRRGRLCFVGRIDEQVKVRGFRVELGEVEAVLRSRPEVLEAAVQPVAAADGRDRLVAYVVPAPGAGFDPEGLERALGERLPPYMVPSTIVRLDAMPLAPTGKLDRKKLPALAAPRRAAERIAPRDELEAAVARVWAQVLELEEVGVRDNFFDLGGHSLLAAQVTARLRRALDVDLKVRALFDHPTVEGLVRSAVAPGLAVDGRRKR